MRPFASANSWNFLFTHNEMRIDPLAAVIINLSFASSQLTFPCVETIHSTSERVIMLELWITTLRIALVRCSAVIKCRTNKFKARILKTPREWPINQEDLFIRGDLLLKVTPAYGDVERINGGMISTEKWLAPPHHTSSHKWKRVSA
jgi:hypothetical protein